MKNVSSGVLQPEMPWNDPHGEYRVDDQVHFVGRSCIFDPLFEHCIKCEIYVLFYFFIANS